MAKFPHYFQLDASSCGPTCLQIICKFYGNFYNSAYLNTLCETGKTSVSLLSIQQAAEQIGLRAKNVKVNFEDLTYLTPPFICEVNQNRFVVVFKITKQSISVSDPQIGIVKYHKKDFRSQWDSEKGGICLLLEPTSKFFLRAQTPDNSNNYTYLLSYLRPYKNLFIQLFLGFFAASLLSLIFPFLTQAIVDVGIGTSNLDFVILVCVAQLVLVVSQTLIEYIRSWIMLQVSIRISISLVSDYLIKLMKLPIRLFDEQFIGDVRQRINDNGRVQQFLTNNLISMSFGVFTFIIYSVVIALYDAQILIIFYGSTALYLVWIFLFLKRRKLLDNQRFKELVEDQNKVFEMITGMQDIKLNSWENQKRWEWEKIQIRLFKVSTELLHLSQSQHIGGVGINQLKNIVISFLAVKAVIDGEITLGMMVAIQFMIGQLNAPVNEFITFIAAAQDTKLSLERLQEIQNKEDEVNVTEKGVGAAKAESIQITNLTFGYPGSLPILNKVNLVIPRGKVTAIVGPSGSGKTTLIKMLLGFYSSNNDEIKIGETSLTQLNLNAWRSRCGAVMQNGVIFTDTITNNIASNSSHIDSEQLKHAVDTANIKEFIEGLPLGYKTIVGRNGVNLSQGQRQRLLIARAVYRNPDYLFFDEATNALDSENEKVIIEKLNQFFSGRTVVVIAHRLSTVRNADQIVVLEKGKIVEQGDHSSLVNLKGKYYNLIENQI